jgi:hypothetical protein
MAYTPNTRYASNDALKCDFGDRFIQSLEDQISLHKKQQYEQDGQLKRLCTRIAHLERQLKEVECSRCHKPAHGHLSCWDRDNLAYEQQKRIQEKLLKGPACNACRLQKRKCDRQRPSCSYCVKQHRKKPEHPECTYPEKKRRIGDEIAIAEGAYQEMPLSPSTASSTKQEESPSICNTYII